MNEHRVTGSAVTRRKKTIPGKKTKVISLTVVTVRCSCGQSVEGAARSLAQAEISMQLAYRAHKR